MTPTLTRRPHLALTAALATTAAALALPGAAPAATPKAGSLYGGGALGALPQPGHHDVQYTSIRVAKDGRTLNFFGEWQLACPGRPTTGPAYFVAEKVAMKADGSFSGAASLDGSGSGGSQKGTVRFAGRFGADGIVRGTGKGALAITPTSGAPYTCGQTIRWTATAPAVRRAAGPFRPAQTWYGTTNQTYPFLLRTRSSGRAVAQASVEYDVKCGRQTQRVGSFNETLAGPLAVDASGAFKQTETFVSSAAFAPGTTATVTAALTGRFGPRNLSGTWRIRVALKDAAGTQVDTCDSGPITFRAAR